MNIELLIFIIDQWGIFESLKSKIEEHLFNLSNMTLQHHEHKFKLLFFFNNNYIVF